jgi:hypothetical protein
MIREKKIPIKNIYIKQPDFDVIDSGGINNMDAPNLKKIRLNSELTTFHGSMVLAEDEALLERGQLWRRLYWRTKKTDLVTEALGDVDIFCSESGQRLRKALYKLETRNY